MNRTIRTVTLAAGVAALLVAGTARARAQQGMPPLPKPGPEHEVLKADVGVWDAVVETFAAPGQPPSTSKGVETNALMGGMWVVTEFKGDMMGMPFEGRGVTGYDAVKKKYVGTWVDTMSVGIAHAEFTYDAATKTMSGTMAGPDMTGTMVKMRETIVYKDANTRVFTLFSPAPDGKEAPIMRITYTRRK
jgi:hypothetical protein